MLTGSFARIAGADYSVTPPHEQGTTRGEEIADRVGLGAQVHARRLPAALDLWGQGGARCGRGCITEVVTTWKPLDGAAPPWPGGE